MTREEIFEQREKVQSMTLRVTNVTVFDETETISGKVEVMLQFSEKFDGTNKEDVLVQVNHINIRRSILQHMLNNVSEDIEMLRSMQREGFSQREWALLLVGSKLSLERINVPKGTEYEYTDDAGKVVKNITARDNNWFTNIVGYHPSKRATKSIDKALEF